MNTPAASSLSAAMAQAAAPVNILTLEDPIECHGKTISQLTIRKPKVRDIRLARKSTDAAEDIEQRLLANLCDLPPEAIDEMSLSDYVRLQAKVTDFLPKDLGARAMTSAIGS